MKFYVQKAREPQNIFPTSEHACNGYRIPKELTVLQPELLTHISTLLFNQKKASLVQFTRQ